MSAWKEAAKAGWKGIRAFAGTDTGKFIGGTIAAGSAASALTDQGFGGGWNASMWGMGGGSLGYFRGGWKGAALGAAAGIGAGIGLTAATPDNAFAAAGVGAVSTSMAASLMSAGTLRGGMLHGAIKAGLGAQAKKLGGTADDIINMMTPMIGHNPLTDPRGFSANFTDMLKSSAANVDQLGMLVAPKWADRLKRFSGFFERNPTMGRLVDATLGSPGMVNLAKEAGGLQNAAGWDIAKAIGQDVVEGIPIGLGVGAVGAGISIMSGNDDAHNTITGMQEGGMAGWLRKQNTDFGSGWRGLTNSIMGFARRSNIAHRASMYSLPGMAMMGALKGAGGLLSAMGTGPGRIALGAIGGGIAGYAGSDSESANVSLQSAFKGAALGAIGGGLTTKLAAQSYIGAGKVAGLAAWANKGDFARLGWGGAKKAAAFAFHNPLVAAGGGLGLIGGWKMLGAANNPNAASPTLSGGRADVQYNRQAAAAANLQEGGVAPVGMVGTAPAMRDRYAQAFQDSAAGVVQGLHRGRHG